MKGLFLESGVAGNTKRPDMGGLKKSPRGLGTDQVVEPESGRTVECKCAIS
jgi:hypothetical protein